MHATAVAAHVRKVPHELHPSRHPQVLPGKGPPSNSLVNIEAFTIMNGLSGTFVDK